LHYETPDFLRKFVIVSKRLKAQGPRLKHRAGQATMPAKNKVGTVVAPTFCFLFSILCFLYSNTGYQIPNTRFKLASA
jgi:hypothetical protein